LLLVLFALVSCNKPVQDPRDSLTISVPYELDSLDPHAKTRLSHFGILFNFYEPLVSMDGNMKIHPCLAKQWENPDVYTWIFQLQPSVKFHSGKPLEAADVVYSMNRLLHENEIGRAHV